jgi:hypothetical protein
VGIRGSASEGMAIGRFRPGMWFEYPGAHNGELTLLSRGQAFLFVSNIGYK